MATLDAAAVSSACHRVLPCIVQRNLDVPHNAGAAELLFASEAGCARPPARQPEGLCLGTFCVSHPLAKSSFAVEFSLTPVFAIKQRWEKKQLTLLGAGHLAFVLGKSSCTWTANRRPAEETLSCFGIGQHGVASPCQYEMYGCGPAACG